ncbi:hypothetical protein [Kordia jejudonensis]|uniref:hypothetical protein n=1 Tax=Kordia jejudonensis TaxID=1348245 RepID=UPI00062945B8|nr:hypothetical protein [Kordia jejudonensis]
MKYKLLIYILACSFLISCRSYIYQNPSKGISLYGQEIKATNYSAKVSEHLDSKSFLLRLSILTKDSLHVEQTIRIINNRPKTNINPETGRELVEYVTPSPFLIVKSNKMGKADFYFDSKDKFTLILSFGYVLIKPVMGKKLTLTIYSDK